MKRESEIPPERRSGSSRGGSWLRAYRRYGWRWRYHWALVEGQYERSYEPEPLGLEVVDGVLRPRGLFYGG
jgi:hypothetical protein